MKSNSPAQRAHDFAQRLGIDLPLQLAPMAGACPVSLSVAVVHGGSMGALGALLLEAEQIAHWVQQYRAQTPAPLQMSLWEPEPPARRDPQHEARVPAALACDGPGDDVSMKTRVEPKHHTG